VLKASTTSGGEGKTQKKVALTACMRKLISILNIMIDGRQKGDAKRLLGQLIERTPRSVQDRAHAKPKDR